MQMMPKAMIVVIACVLLAGCTAESLRDVTILGYSIGSQARTDIKTVRVPIFRNTTFFRDIEYELTQAIVKRIEDTTPYKVVNGQADAQLLGTIKSGTSHVGIQNELNEARTRDFTLVVEVSFVDCRTGQDYFMQVTQQPALSSTPTPVNLDPLAPTPAPVLTHLKPRLFNRTAVFAQELGQSFATAKQKVIDDLAVSIVSAMEKNW